MAAQEAAFCGRVAREVARVWSRRSALPDQLDCDTHVGQVPPVPVGGHRWDLKASCEGKAGTSPLGVRPLLGLGFRPPVTDQLIGQAHPGREWANIPRVRSAAARRCLAVDLTALVAWAMA